MTTILISFKQIFILFIFVNFLSGLMFAWQDEAIGDNSTTFFIVINAYFVTYSFVIKRPIRFTIDECKKCCEVDFIQFLFIKTHATFMLSEIGKATYKKEFVARSTSVKKLRIFSKNEILLVLLSPEFFWWEGNDIEKIVNILERYVSVQRNN